MKKINPKYIHAILLLMLAFNLANSCMEDESNNPSDELTDADGNIYHSVTIASQTWMVENLKTTHYNDPLKTPIPNITDNIVWGGLNTPAYCWYENDIGNKETYGALYNWYAASDPRLCPKGWHIPSNAEWATLITNLGGDSTTVGGKMKEEGTSHWISPNTGATNSYGFTALPGGSHFTNGLFYLKGKYGWYWSSTETELDNAWHVYMVYNNSTLARITGSKSIGFSVRCIKDN